MSSLMATGTVVKAHNNVGSMYFSFSTRHYAHAILKAQREGSMQSAVKNTLNLALRHRRVGSVPNSPRGWEVDGQGQCHCAAKRVSLSLHASSERSDCVSSQIGRSRLFSNDASHALNPAPSLSGLGLYHRLVKPHLHVIQQLPEVQAALLQPQIATTNLLRAAEVFETMGKGNPHHVATLALLADAYQIQGQYDKAVTALTEMEECCSKDASEPVILLARSKAAWCSGDFDAALDCSSSVAESPQALSSDFLKACANSSRGLSQLIPIQDMTQAEATTTALRVSATALEHLYEESQSVAVALCAASALSNCGVAELAFRKLVNDKSPSAHATPDVALQSWRDGISLLDRLDPSISTSLQCYEKTYSRLIRSHLYGNMALALLSSPDDSGNLTTASEYASLALHLVETEKEKAARNDYKHALGRALGLTAACYRRADSALTAEGLFKSAIDALEQGRGGAPVKLDLRRTYDEYALLCHSWDKRKRDAETLEQKSRDIDSGLQNSWKGKPDIYSGLCFFVPDTFSS